MNLDNSRHPEQTRKMQELKKNNECHFCKNGFKLTHSSPIIHSNKYWFITANDFPYQGAEHHYLIVSKKHIKDTEEISDKSGLDFFKSIKWLKNKLKVKGYSVFIRSGDMAYTGATLDHLHFHFLVGKKKTKKMNQENRLLVTLGHKK